MLFKSTPGMNQAEGTPPLGLHLAWETCVGVERGATLARENAQNSSNPLKAQGSESKKNSSRVLYHGFLLFLLPLISLSPSHLVVVIHHGISKPFRASVQKWRLRIPWIIGFRVVPPSPLNLLDSLSPSSTSAWWRDKRNPCRQRKHDECLLKIHEITSFGFAFILFICLVNIRSHCCF